MREHLCCLFPPKLLTLPRWHGKYSRPVPQVVRRSHLSWLDSNLSKTLDACLQLCTSVNRHPHPPRRHEGLVSKNFTSLVLQLPFEGWSQTRVECVPSSLQRPFLLVGSDEPGFASLQSFF